MAMKRVLVARNAVLVAVCGAAVVTLGALLTYLDAGKKVVDSFLALHAAVRAIPGLESAPWWGTLAGLVACLAVVGLPPVLLKWNARCRARRLKLGRQDAIDILARTEASRVFRLSPIRERKPGQTPFDRADKRHEEIFRWIRDSDLSLLYVTGQSGSGKSSLLQAYVAPMLRADQDGANGASAPASHVAVSRAFGDIDEVIRQAVRSTECNLGPSGDLSELGARQVLELVAAKAAEENRKFVLIFDQFEEVFAGVDPTLWAHIPAILLAKCLHDQPIPNLCCVLVARSDDTWTLHGVGLPKRVEERNWQDVPAFSLPDAAAFLLKCLNSEDRLLAVTLAKQAETLVNLPGHVTPIALNMIGQVFDEDPVLGRRLAQPDTDAAEGVLPAYVRRRIESGNMREVGPAVLEQLVTLSGRRQKPLAAPHLALAAKLPIGVVEVALLTLQTQGLVRPVGDLWEVAHDFLAPLLRRTLDQLRLSVWRHLRRWLPVPTAAVLGLLIAGSWGWGQGRIAFDARSFQECANTYPDNQEVAFFKRPTRAAVRHLRQLGGVWRIVLQYPDQAPEDLLPFRGIRLPNVEALAPDLRTDAWLKELARADSAFVGLTRLTAVGSEITDTGMKAFARSDTGLKALTMLELDATGVTHLGLKDISSPDTGLTALSSLRMNTMDDAGLRELARADTGLKDLSVLHLDKAGVTDTGLKILAGGNTGLKNLTRLFLRETQVTDSALDALARPDAGLKSLAELFLGDTQVTDSGLKALARCHSSVGALTHLDLSGTRVTDAGLEDLARPGTGLRALTHLDLSGTNVTDAGLEKLVQPAAGITHLQCLDVDVNGVTSKGVRAIRERFPDCKVVWNGTQ